MKNAKENKGITLVALIITVIVLLILAGVTISLVIGENGVINKSKETAKTTFEKDVQESLELAIADLEISKTESGEKVEITDLLEKGYINEEGVININKLLGKKGQYGNGANKQDVFIIENNELWYYEKNGDGKKISKLSNLGYLPTSEDKFQIVGTSINLAKYEEYYIENEVTGKEAPLEIYVIPNKINGITVDTVGHFNASNIKKIIISEGIKKIDVCSFSDCKNLITVKMPNTITQIEDSAFKGCSNIKKMEVPESVENIGKGAFSECSELENIVLPNNIKNITGGMFGGCTKLNQITIPKSTTLIGETAFRGCTSLSSIEIPKEVTNIGNCAFEECTNLESIIIPKKMTTIGKQAFNNCTNLKTVNYEGSEEDWAQIKIGKFNDALTNAKINYNYKYQE